jgi:serine-type D-Ala-D-Ala carboxypeptidase/endopeptidase (penicillin-binding protein 4)
MTAKRLRSGKILYCILLSLLACGPLGAQLAKISEEWKNDPLLKNASIAYCVLDAETGSVVAEYNSGQSLAPASTLKLLTTAAAVAILGNDFRYLTVIEHSGNFDKGTGVLTGDLYIRGSGDPTLNSENFIKQGTSVTDVWAVSLKEKGIKEVRGSVIGDASAVKRTVPDHWVWCDISNYFGAVPCGLSFSDNKYKLNFRTGVAGSTATLVSVSPSFLTSSLVAKTSVISKGSEDAAYIYGDPFGAQKEIRGSLPPGQEHFEIGGAMPDPALACAEMFKQSLAKQGIKVAGNAQSLYDKRKDECQTMLSHYSPALEKIVYYTNLKSNNHYCESLLSTLGGGSADKGIMAVKAYWASRGLDTTEFYMADGSGLARASTVTARLQAAALSRVYSDPGIYKTINNSLSVAGREGPLRNMGKGELAEGRLRAKSGYILRARSYAGYVLNNSGREMAFSVIFNNYNCSPKEAKSRMERFLTELAKL